MKNLFFTSDWHLFHEKVLEFDSRPFSCVEHMHRVLINNYNASVSQDSICYFLGDFSQGNQEKTAEIISQLNGTKIFVMGNHDKSPTSMKAAGFDAVLHMAAIVIGKEMVTMTHCPLRGVFREDVSQMKSSYQGENWHGELKHKNFSIDNFGQFHLHGHCHKTKEEKIADRQFDVGVRANDYRPVSSSQIESWIALTKQENK